MMEICPHCGNKSLIVTFGSHTCIVCKYTTTDK
jgi:hypothetical protein